jgi:hypothetical protein
MTPKLRSTFQPLWSTVNMTIKNDAFIAPTITHNGVELGPVLVIKLTADGKLPKSLQPYIEHGSMNYSTWSVSHVHSVLSNDAR